MLFWGEAQVPRGQGGRWPSQGPQSCLCCPGAPCTHTCHSCFPILPLNTPSPLLFTLNSCAWVSPNHPYQAPGLVPGKLLLTPPSSTRPSYLELGHTGLGWDQLGWSPHPPVPLGPQATLGAALETPNSAWMPQGPKNIASSDPCIDLQPGEFGGHCCSPPPRYKELLTFNTQVVLHHRTHACMVKLE